LVSDISYVSFVNTLTRIITQIVVISLWMATLPSIGQRNLLVTS
jgi:hypothetical protein